VHDQVISVTLYDGQIVFPLQLDDFANLMTAESIPQLLAIEKRGMTQADIARAGSDCRMTIDLCSVAHSQKAHMVFVASPHGFVFRDVRFSVPTIRPELLIN
jgi:hypothetical protein